VLGVTGSNSIIQPLSARLQTPVLKQAARSCGLSDRQVEEIAARYAMPLIFVRSTWWRNGRRQRGVVGGCRIRVPGSGRRDAAYAVAGLGIELFNVPWFTATLREVEPDKLARVSSMAFAITAVCARVCASDDAGAGTSTGRTTGPAPRASRLRSRSRRCIGTGCPRVRRR
jgi:hypothetical protein